MTIKAYDPKDWTASNIVQVDSDAKDNQAAIDDIESWAADNGFARVNENWLRQIFRDGQRYFRGVCYRLTPEEQESSSTVCEMSAEAMGELPATPHRPKTD